MADVESLKKYYKHATSQINSKLTSKLTMKISCIYCKPHMSLNWEKLQKLQLWTLPNKMPVVFHYL